jgi:hypothetical protein
MMTPDFLVDVMKDLDLRYFRIFNMDYARMYENFQPVSLQQAQDRMREFFKRAGDGSYRVILFKNGKLKSNGQPAEEGFEYEVVKSSTLQDNNPPAGNGGIGSIGGNFHGGYMGAVDMPTHLASKDQIMELRLQLLSKENEIARLNDRINDLERRHLEELEKAKNPQELIKSVAPTIMGAIQGMDLSKFTGQAPMNGVGAMPQEQDINIFSTNIMSNVNTAQKTMVDSINKLIKIDPNFPTNVAKLAELAEKKPEIYKLAVQQLNSL